MTLLVPTYSRSEKLLCCFHSLANQTRYPDEIIFVVRDTDHETQDALKSMLKAFYYTKISPTVWGISSESGYLLKVVTVFQADKIAALDAGLAEATGDVISIMGNTVIPHPRWLAHIESHFMENLNRDGDQDWLYFADNLQAVPGKLNLAYCREQVA
ncbi:MAG: glycosyltransferase [Symploca sp. SIO2B6]|nr:glycosyltransferase [Symploca sp. SIO2B6]